jgi:hypothetical protein
MENDRERPRPVNIAICPRPGPRIYIVPLAVQSVLESGRLTRFLRPYVATRRW